MLDSRSLTRRIAVAGALALIVLSGACNVRVAEAATTVATATAQTATATATAQGATDPYLWLESVDSPRAMQWVNAENAKTLGVLQADPGFAPAYAQALALGEAKDRIPAPEFLANRIYNFWQDASHVRGIWRRTTLADYAIAAPAWETVLDLDALAKSEGKNWVWHGANCAPGEHRCLIQLSDGGEDATTIREFDLASASFVANGFVLPHGKQDVAWLDDETLLVAREWQPGELTASGYPYIVKRLARGTALDAAVEISRGSKSDVSVAPSVVIDGDGDRLATVERGTSFFEHETYVVAKDAVRRLAIPLKASPVGMVGKRVLIKTEEPWRGAGATVAAGSLASVDLDALVADPAHLKATIVYAPGARETLESVATTHDRVLVSTYENVRGRAYVMTPQPAGPWLKHRLALPDQSSIAPVDANLHGTQAFVSVTSFLVPSTLVLADTLTDAVSDVKALAPKFDASRDVVEQFEATSTDGTRVPYFVVHPASMRYDGATPTIMNAYGGFQVSETPTYSGALGKLWLERGGVFVLANVRGGGEFGPAWHEAGLKTNRQRIYDDFAAVARDLAKRKIADAAHLGIRGGSNGGLLMGVALTQHPELFGAVDIAVPLLDMLRFEQIAAGASWVGEYGSVAVPAERAFLAQISPYNNLRAGVRYPEPFIWTTTKDDRVGPQHARKFAAKLSQLGDPYLYYEVTEGGHGAGANIKEQSFTTALEYTYFARQLISPRSR
ncbi:MAG: prolyl oligopeptidase family protein [Vulcanimicrobiaceae bacterium]